jgi:capsular polysaccharide transport system permease protein
MRSLFLFVLIVVLPTVVAVIYFGMFAADVYVSASRFVVRSSQEGGNISPLGLLLKGSALSRSADDDFVVREFILSRDAMAQLNKQMDIAGMFADRNVDRFSRFGGISSDRSFEALYKYYQKHVNVEIDSESPVVTLETRAFSAQDSYLMNEVLLNMSEDLVNQLNERARKDLIGFALREVGEAEQRNAEASLALGTFRTTEGVIDPEKESTIPLQQVSRLQDDLTATKIKISQLEIIAPQNPQLPILRSREKSLESEIETVRSEVTGSQGSLASKTADYQRLVLRREFTDKMLASALSALDVARNEARRKSVYLERIAQPSVPDEAIEPKRVHLIIATFLVGLVVWGIVSMLVAGIREHQD